MQISIQNSILATALTTLVSCSAGFNSSPYYDLDPMKPQKGVTYKLPRTVVDYSLNYTLYSITEKPADKEVIRYQAWIEGAAPTDAPFTLTAKQIGDDRAVFLINTPDLAAFSVHTKGSGFSLSEEGVLTAANGEFDDKTTEITEKFVSAGLKFAKLAVNPTGATGRNAGDTYPKVENLGTVTITGQINYARLQEIHGHSIAYTIPTEYVRQQLKRKTRGTEISVPVVTVKFAPETDYNQLTTASAARALNAPRALRHSKKFSGLWVRQPASVPFSISVDGDTMLEDRMLIADAGPTTLVPVRSRIMTDRSTTLAFHTGTGGISKHDFTSTSQGEKLATSVDTISDTVTTQVTGIMQGRQARADEKNKIQTLIATEERKIQDAQSEIKDINDQIADLNKEDKDLEEKLRKADEDNMPDNEYKALEEEVKKRKLAIGSEQKNLERDRTSEERKVADAEREIDYLNAKLGRM